MTTIALGVAAFSLILVFVSPRPRQRDFGPLNEPQLQRYIAYASKALADGGWIFVRKDGLRSPIGIKKHALNGVATLTVQVSSGDHPRADVRAVAEWLEKEGIEHCLTLSRKQKLPRWASVHLPADDPLMPSACTHVIDEMSEALGAKGDSYSLRLGGRYRHGFAPEDGEVIPHARSRRYGYAVGHWIGSLMRAFRTRD